MTNVFNGKTVVIPFMEVVRVEKRYAPVYDNSLGFLMYTGYNYSKFKGIEVITRNSIYNSEGSYYENTVLISAEDNEATRFVEEWTKYINKIES